MNQRKSTSTKIGLLVNSQLNAAWEVIRRGAAWNDEEIIEALYHGARVTRLEANQLLRWMLQHGIVTRVVTPVSTGDKARKSGEKIIRSKYAARKIRRLLPRPKQKGWESSVAQTVSAPTKYRTIKHNIELNFALFLRTVREAEDKLRGADRFSYASDIRWLRFVRAEIQKLLSHYKSVGKLDVEIAGTIEKLYNAIHALLEERDGEATREALEAFEWPNVDIARVLDSRELGRFDAGEGVLSAFGYHVGMNGVNQVARYRILAQILDDTSKLKNLPARSGAPKSCTRLRLVAYTIAGCVWRANRRLGADTHVALREWLEDLEWLKATYYDGKCDGDVTEAKFPWPPLLQ